MTNKPLVFAFHEVQHEQKKQQKKEALLLLKKL